MTVLLHCHAYGIMQFDKLCREHLMSKKMSMPERIESTLIKKPIDDPLDVCRKVSVHREARLESGGNEITYKSESVVLPAMIFEGD